MSYYLIEYNTPWGEKWSAANEPNLFDTLHEARELLRIEADLGLRVTPVKDHYRIVDVRSKKVYEATGDAPVNFKPAPSIPTEVAGGEFATKTSGVQESIGNMVRSPAAGKTNFTLILRGPMFQRWADLLTRGAVVYGADNWLEGLREADPAKRLAIKKRYLESGSRHYVQWIRGDRDEDHAAAVFFNINGYEAMVWTDNIVTRKERLEELERLIQ